MAESIYSSDPNQKTTFIIDQKNIAKISGKWNYDSNLFDIHQKTFGEPSTSRLIMGFGPSASGKTQWMENMIELFWKIYPNFPSTFMTIDGEIYRKKSVIYRLIVREIMALNCAGFKNLVVTGLNLTREKSLFEASIIKNVITEYLGNQINKLRNLNKLNELLREQIKNLKISLYVPDTLGNCGMIKSNCHEKYNKYIHITKDRNWIGLLIWQHKIASECTFTPLHKCYGCEQTGKDTEKKDGKIYSSSAWSHSMKMGENEFMKAPGGKYKIHNCGDQKTQSGLKCISVIEDHTDYKKISNGEKAQEVFTNAENKLKLYYYYYHV